MKRFRQAVEARDIDAMLATLHADVVFRSPLIWKPIVGKAAVSQYLRVADSDGLGEAMKARLAAA